MFSGWISCWQRYRLNGLRFLPTRRIPKWRRSRKLSVMRSRQDAESNRQSGVSWMCVGTVHGIRAVQEDDVWRMWQRRIPRWTWPIELQMVQGRQVESHPCFDHCFRLYQLHGRDLFQSRRRQFGQYMHWMSARKERKKRRWCHFWKRWMRWLRKRRISWWCRRCHGLFELSSRLQERNKF